MKNQELAQILYSSLNNEKRYKHSCGVAKTAERLAIKYGASAEKAYLAGLLHDCGREYPTSELLAAAKQCQIPISVYDRMAPILLHAPLGAVLAQCKYGISDPDILRSISLHTIGGAAMSILAKIIYLADMIEPARDYAGAAELRRLADIDLDKALAAAFDQSLNFIISKQQLIHPDTVLARNEIFLRNFENGQSKEEHKN